LKPLGISTTTTYYWKEEKKKEIEIAGKGSRKKKKSSSGIPSSPSSVTGENPVCNITIRSICEGKRGKRKLRWKPRKSRGGKKKNQITEP